MNNNENLEKLRAAVEAYPEITLPQKLSEALKEYTEVQSLDWNGAVENVRFLMGEALMLGPTGYFYMMACQNMLKRYENGERTRELYEEMKDAH